MITILTYVLEAVSVLLFVGGFGILGSIFVGVNLQHLWLFQAAPYMILVGTMGIADMIVGH